MMLRFPVQDQSRLHAYPPGMWVFFELIDESPSDASDRDTHHTQSSESDSYEGFGQNASQLAASPNSPSFSRGESSPESPSSLKGDEAGEGDDLMNVQNDLEVDVSNNPKALQRRKFCHCYHTLLEH